MIYFLGVVLFIILLISLLLSFPVRLWLDSNLILRINWFAIRVLVPFEGRDTRPVVYVLGKEIKKKEKKKKEKVKKEKPDSKKKDKKKKKKKSKKRSITKEMIFEILKDKAILKTLRQLRRLLFRLIKAGKIPVLRVDFSLDDYYRQGVLMGLLGAVPATRDFQIRGNFEQRTDFTVAIRISLWRLVSAVAIMLFRLPYIRAIRLYLRYR